MSIESVAKAKSMAQEFGAAIHLAHVHHQQYPATFMGPVLSSGEPVTSFEEHRERALREELKEVARQNSLSPDSSIHLCEGASVYHEICRLAQKIPADLIVMPTHGRTGLRHTFLGSTAERVVQHSPCPVLVTRTRKGKAAKAAAEMTGPGRAKTILVPVDFSEASSAALHYAIEFAEPRRRQADHFARGLCRGRSQHGRHRYLPAFRRQGKSPRRSGAPAWEHFCAR